MNTRIAAAVLAALACLLPAAPSLADQAAADAQALVRAAWNQLRGKASVAEVTMTIQRPTWRRQMAMVGWTKGTDKSLIRITAPAKDRGNATLKVGRTMWTFNPRIRRVIKLPPALMAQSWMGSDFSNNDLAKSDSILTDYRHRTAGSFRRDGHTVYRIVSRPLPDAPVVWGKIELEVRDDAVLLAERFFDEDDRLVKQMVCSGIRPLGGRLFPAVWIMRKAGATDAFTRLDYRSLRFVDDLDDGLFTIGSLKNPAGPTP